MKHLLIELYKKITGLNKKIIRNAAEIVSNTLKNALCCDDKNTQRVHDKWCTGKNWPTVQLFFLKTISTRTGIHIYKFRIWS